MRALFFIQLYSCTCVHPHDVSLCLMLSSPTGIVHRHQLPCRATSRMVMDIKRLDIYRKIPKDLTQPTTTGAVVSICCVSFIVLMIFTEVSSLKWSLIASLLRNQKP